MMEIKGHKLFDDGISAAATVRFLVAFVQNEGPVSESALKAWLEEAEAAKTALNAWIESVHEDLAGKQNDSHLAMCDEVIERLLTLDQRWTDIERASVYDLVVAGFTVEQVVALAMTFGRR